MHARHKEKTEEHDPGGRQHDGEGEALVYPCIGVVAVSAPGFTCS